LLPRLKPLDAYQRRARWLGAAVLALGWLAPTTLARAQGECPEDEPRCCANAGLIAQYLVDGSTDVSRWTPVLRPDMFRVYDEAGEVVASQPNAASPCGELFVPVEPLQPNHTYTIRGTLLEEQFTTGENAEQPELVVEVGEDLDPGEGFRAEVHFSQAPVVIVVQEGRWVEVATAQLGVDWTLQFSGNRAHVTFVGAQGQYVVVDVEGIAPTEDEDGGDGGCSCQAAPSPVTPWWVLAASLIAVAARRRRCELRALR
jgi:MYXO-CTERM domain-containing protein